MKFKHEINYSLKSQIKAVIKTIKSLHVKVIDY